MTFSQFERQFIVKVASECHPNSPKEERQWAYVQRDLRRFSGHIVDGLVRAGFLERRGVGKDSWMLKPTAVALELVAEEKKARYYRKRRPPLFGVPIFDVPAFL